MIESNFKKYFLLNNMRFQEQENQYMFNNIYKCQNYFNQNNYFYQFQTIYQIYNNENIFIKKKNNLRNKKHKILHTDKQKFNNENTSLNKKENNYLKNKDSSKNENKRKTSLETAISGNSFNSYSNDEKQCEEKGKVKEKEECLIYPDFQLNIKEISINNKQKKMKNKTEEGENKALIQKKEKKMVYEVNPEFENTEILRVNVKISKDKFVVFKLKRFDDVFETIKLFCEINLIDEKLLI